MNLDDVENSEIKKVGSIYYYTDKFLGKGASGHVFYGYHQVKEKIAAIKVISKASLDEYKRTILNREIENLQKGVNHKNIVELFMLAQTANTFYMCMEYCSNGTLKSYMEGKTRTKELIFNVTLDILEGFRFLYENSIIHRDIKPENLLVDKNGVIKIADFGFSKTLDEKDKAQSGTFVGSPAYASSEVVNQEKYSAKCDVYSVGVVLFEFIFGYHPMFSPTIPPKTMGDLIKKFQENKKIVFPNQPVLSENYKNMLEGMLKVKEADRLSWPEVLNMFELEKLTDEEKKEKIKEEVLKIHNEKLETAEFYNYAADAIQDVISVEVNDSPDEENLQNLTLFRLKFLALNFYSLALRRVSKNFSNSPEAKDFPEFLSKINIPMADFKYGKEYRNIWILELNRYLKLNETNPEKNENAEEELKEMLMIKISDIFDIFEGKVENKPEGKKLLLCLHMLKNHPLIPEGAKNFVENNMKKSPQEISNIIFK